MNPLVDDLVCIINSTNLELYLKVVRRKWVNGRLQCELHLPHYFPTIDSIEKILKERGFRWF